MPPRTKVIRKGGFSWPKPRLLPETEDALGKALSGLPSLAPERRLRVAGILQECIRDQRESGLRDPLLNLLLAKREVQKELRPGAKGPALQQIEAKIKAANQAIQQRIQFLQKASLR